MRTRGEIKELAKFQFRQRYGMSVGAALLLILLGGGQSTGANFNFTFNSSSINDLHLDRIPFAGALVSWIIATIVALAGIVWLIHLFVGLPLEVGHAHFSRCIYNNWITSVGEMFRRGFGDYGRHLGGLLWRDLFIFLWSLLFVIPGIVKRYAYFAAPYLLAEFPAVRATDAIKLSMRMTYGYKADLFVLDLSFIGWNLLSALTLGLLGILYVNPYYYTSKAGMYEELKNNALLTGAVRYEELAGYPAPPPGYTPAQ